MLDILRKLNQDRERALLIGRNAFNYQLVDVIKSANTEFITSDYDVICPNYATAVECSDLLKSEGFTLSGATFIAPDRGELDLVISDDKQPQEVIGGFYNIPTLKPLWDERVMSNGILVAPAESMIFNKLLFTRENEGKDLETISIYFELRPDSFNRVLERVDKHPINDEREAMLYSLYMGVNENPTLRQQVEDIIQSDIRKPDKSAKEVPR